MKLRKTVFRINVLLAAAMVIHVGISMLLHAQHPEYSAPVYVELINAVFYLVPIAIIDIVYLIIKNTEKKGTARTAPRLRAAKPVPNAPRGIRKCPKTLRV